jgi:hypothetical protein
MRIERFVSPVSTPQATCRFCSSILKKTFADLGSSPLCQRHIEPDHWNDMEPFYPLHAYVCEECFLVQLDEYVSPSEIFRDYAYFSSFSSSWLEHAQAYAKRMTSQLNLGPASKVVEIASNDGYLLQFFAKQGIPVLGVEPAANVAQSAIAKGIPTVTRFFGAETASDLLAEHGPADLLLGNNVLAHVPRLNDFVAGLKILLGERGVLTMEFPHLQQLIANNQFDTIYHEHFSYLSLITVERVFAHHGLTIFDVEELSTHGGSLRIYARHERDRTKPVTAAVAALADRERAFGLTEISTYTAFRHRVERTKRNLLTFLIDAKNAGQSVVGYGAPGKGNTLLNFCGIRTDFLDYTVDLSPHKQGRFLPGSRIPIMHPEQINLTKPDYVLILPWNLKEEIMTQMQHVRTWGARFVVPIPDVSVH